jgi:tetratricopeptide (TPR) repeat protein
MMSDESTLPREAVLAHLRTLLADRRFVSAERNARFLRYVVENTLDGKGGEIKETVIAADVYGRTDGYDPKADSIVRVEATRLRQKLRAYYENEGRDSQVRIHLPSGTYVPQFETVAAPSVMEAPAPAGIAKASNSRPIAWAGIAAAFAFLLSLEIATQSRAEVAHHPDAVAAWQEGIALFNQDPHSAQTEKGAPPTLIRALERLEFAVARDPKFAPAWATLAEGYDYLFPYVGRDQREDARRAEEAARRAIALDGRLAAGHHMLGLILWMMKWDFTAAERSYRRALEIDPRNVYAAVEYADLLRETGRSAEAGEVIRRSRALLPGLPQLASKEAEIHLDLARSDAAIAAAESALQYNRTFLRANIALGMAQESKGNADAALAEYQRVLALDPKDRRALPASGYLLGRTGQRVRALDIIARLERMNETVRNCSFQIAVVYAGLNEHDHALEWLERAWRTHQVHFPFAAVEPRFNSLRNNPRFRALLSRIGLKPVPVPGLTSVT